MQNHFQLTKLDNGARIVTAEMPHMHSVSIGIWAGVGGRHEPARVSGIAHFLEHLMFKGTRRRSAREVAEAVEGIGGYLNAFTSEDHTCYYAKAAARHLAEVSDVLCDMYCGSLLKREEVERERNVIREEIFMYRDQPAQHADELLAETMWPRHPLGRPLTGTEETVGRMRRGDLLEFMRERYVGRNTTVTVAGAVRHEEVLAALAKPMGALKPGRLPVCRRAPSVQKGPAISIVTQKTEQVHLAMGFHAFGRKDARRFALKLLSVILGENMSSRLFQRLREENAFCYSVQTSVDTFADTGAFCVCAGLDSDKLERAMRMTMRELDKVCKKAPTRAELRKAQDYTIGQMRIGLESTTNQMMWMGESVLGHGRVLDPGEVERRLLAVTPEEIVAVARHCLDQARLGVAIVGPVKDRERVANWLR